MSDFDSLGGYHERAFPVVRSAVIREPFIRPQFNWELNPPAPMRNAAAGDNGSNTPKSLSSPPANGLSDYFFVAEGCLPYCPSAPFARQVQASRPPLLRMLSLRIGPLIAPLSVWRRPLSVDTCPPMMAFRRSRSLEQPPRLSSCSSYMSSAFISGA